MQVGDLASAPRGEGFESLHDSGQLFRDDQNASSLSMGISVGWGDRYGSTLRDQYIDVTNLTSDNYRLHATRRRRGRTAVESLVHVPRKRRNKADRGALIGPRTYAVTLVRPDPPFIEVGAYAYTAAKLPVEGATITLRSVLSPWGPRLHELAAQVTRVDPRSETPISATAVADD